MHKPSIELTEEARQQFVGFLAAEKKDDLAILLAIRGYGPHGFRYELDIVCESEVEDAVAVDFEGFRMLVDAASAAELDGVKIDFLVRGLESGFRFDNPNSRWQDPVARAVQEVLDTQVNPSVASHGGYVELLDVVDDTAYISLGGGCHGCGMADVTLKQGVEVAITGAVAEIEQVLDTTDHAAGKNPYFRPDKSGASPFG